MKKKSTSSKSSAAVTKTKESPLAHKLGANRGETAKRQRKLDKNFKQSRDVREDRGIRQVKMDPKNQGRETR
jgi:hypothetical protein